MLGQRSNHYVPTRQINYFAENLARQGICRFCIERTVRTECPSKPLFLAKPPVNFCPDYRIAQDYTRRWPGREHRETTSQKHRNSFPSSAKGRAGFSRALTSTSAYNSLPSWERPRSGRSLPEAIRGLTTLIKMRRAADACPTAPRI